MLKIIITGFSGTDLLLEVNGRPNNGRSSAHATEQVKWEIQSGSGVKEIVEIKMKSIGGSDDVFSNDPPKEENGSHKKKWKAKVNTNASVGEVYVYYITWVKEEDGLTYTYDPIISIRPRAVASVEFLALSTLVVVSTFSYMLYKIYMLRKGLH